MKPFNIDEGILAYRNHVAPRIMASVLLAIALAFFLVASGARAQSNTNVCFTLLSATPTTAATINTPLQNNFSWRGIAITPFVSKWTSGVYTLHVQGALAATPVNFYDIIIGTALTATSTVATTTPIVVYPGVAVTSGFSASTVLPAQWRMQLIGTATPSMTISVSGCLVN